MKKRDDLYLREMESRIQKIASHLKKTSQAKFMKSDLHRSAVVRELEVIGEAASKVSSETRKLFATIPWNQMIGMRNRLIHGYFDVDYSIVWEVAKLELPKIVGPIRSAILQSAPPIHPWRVCPSGYYHVRDHERAVGVTPLHPRGETFIRQHCRRNPSGKDQLYPKEILEIFEVGSKQTGELGSVGGVDLKTFPTGNDFDLPILVWTKYWNDIFGPAVSLEANIVKALLGSESTFGRNVDNVRIGKGNFARGPFQITDATRKILANEKGEIKEHYLTLTAKDVKDPVISAAACVRWLFQKKKLASSYLKREATWEEAVADYKSYLRRKGPRKGMETFNILLAKLRNKK